MRPRDLVDKTVRDVGRQPIHTSILISIFSIPCFVIVQFISQIANTNLFESVSLIFIQSLILSISPGIYLSSWASSLFVQPHGAQEVYLALGISLIVINIIYYYSIARIAEQYRITIYTYVMYILLLSMYFAHVYQRSELIVFAGLLVGLIVVRTKK